jgi:hypothetical protein
VPRTIVLQPGQTPPGTPAPADPAAAPADAGGVPADQSGSFVPMDSGAPAPAPRRSTAVPPRRRPPPAGSGAAPVATQPPSRLRRRPPVRGRSVRERCTAEADLDVRLHSAAGAWVERRFHAMGSTAHVVVLGGSEQDLDFAEQETAARGAVEPVPARQRRRAARDAGRRRRRSRRRPSPSPARPRRMARPTVGSTRRCSACWRRRATTPPSRSCGQGRRRAQW